MFGCRLEGRSYNSSCQKVMWPWTKPNSKFSLCINCAVVRLIYLLSHKDLALLELEGTLEVFMESCHFTRGKTWGQKQWNDSSKSDSSLLAELGLDSKAEAFPGMLPRHPACSLPPCQANIPPTPGRWWHQVRHGQTYCPSLVSRCPTLPNDLVFPTLPQYTFLPVTSRDDLVSYFPEKIEISQGHMGHGLPSSLLTAICLPLVVTASVPTLFDTGSWGLVPPCHSRKTFEGFAVPLFSTPSSPKDLPCQHLYIIWTLPFKTLFKIPLQWACFTQLLT